MLFSSWSQLTPTLVFSCIVFLQGALLFGIDTGSFGSLQALPSFLRRFGVEDSSSPGTYTLPASQQSLMNSLPWVGKLAGCLTSESIIDRIGFKRTMYIVSFIQIVAVVVELTAAVEPLPSGSSTTNNNSWVQFTIGRILAYAAVGLVENVVPSYNAEVSPAATRGLLSGSLMVVTGLGNLWGAGMSKAYDSETGDKGWIVPTSMQLVPAVLLLFLVPFTPESPRWLILRGRKDQGRASLDRLRKRDEVADGTTAQEADLIERSIEGAGARDQGSWLDLFRGNYLRRTWICATLFFFHEMNGNQFVQSYAATFYVQQGLGSMSFTYATIGQAVGIVGCGIGLVLLDIAGRRILLICGSAFCALILYLAAGLGTHGVDMTQAQLHTMVACFIMVPAFTRFSASNQAFLTGAEIGGVRMRKKTMAFGTACDVVAAFLVTFVTPYLLPSMGPKIGFIFGSVDAFAVIWGYLFFPELKGRSLEEVDELFDARLSARRFAGYQSQGEGAVLRVLEQHRTNGADKPKEVIVEHSG